MARLIFPSEKDNYCQQLERSGALLNFLACTLFFGGLAAWSAAPFLLKGENRLKALAATGGAGMVLILIGIQLDQNQRLVEPIKKMEREIYLQKLAASQMAAEQFYEQLAMSQIASQMQAQNYPEVPQAQGFPLPEGDRPASPSPSALPNLPTPYSEQVVSDAPTGSGSGSNLEGNTEDGQLKEQIQVLKNSGAKLTEIVSQLWGVKPSGRAYQQARQEYKRIMGE